MSDHLPRRPRDLASEEQAVSDWFQNLDRSDAPSALRAAVLESRPAAHPRRRKPAGRLLQMVPFGGWGIASAALVLAALGAAVTVELTTPVEPPVLTYEAAGNLGESLIVRTDPAMSLYHGLEIFDGVGLPQGEVIAGWGR